MIKTAIGLHQDEVAAIKAAWAARSIKMDWEGLENTLRAILANCRVADQNDTVLQIDDAIAAFTKRGNALNPREEWPSVMDAAETPFAENH